MLNTVTATLGSPRRSRRSPSATSSARSSGRPGLFTAPIEVASLAEFDDLGRLLHGWAPATDSDLL